MTEPLKLAQTFRWMTLEEAPLEERGLLWLDDPTTNSRAYVFGKVYEANKGRYGVGEGLNGNWRYTHFALLSPPDIDQSPSSF